MKRLHVHVSVADVEDSVRFYATLFGTEPAVRQADYAKWMLDDPRVNFAISRRGRKTGLDHLGIQVEDAGELSAITAQLQSAGRPVVEQADAACCYARSDKTWVADPQGIAWETFLTHGSETVYGDDTVATEALPTQGTGACCAKPAA